ncbi:hypothetical protein OG946_21075 [Streptomyces sp. NBC_01808]|uniref:hypothetical protein n=1 Tax=Streptomyces sp. NBC_01808 TaxID=2975947 RepID=UPI002DD89BD5|nr:hypothetical protein [Streptomyces sp. NBC_01808]WSA39638.1 hypothetical protein OG946_21075 [Streptomyces sp. NBC_01808]
MSRRSLTPHGTRATATVAALACGLLLASAGGAAADRGTGTTDTGGGSGNGGVNSTVKFEYHSPGGGQPMTSSTGNWSPPVCWFEPRYTNDALAKHNEEMEDKGPLEGIDHDTAENRKEETDAHKDKDGMWWERTPVMSPRSCEIGELWIWVDRGDPDPPADAIDPEILAGLAYAETKLPAPPVDLKPNADRNVVNLPTKIEFSEPLDRVWTTASLANAQAGINIAATTVAEPVSLRIDAGTEYAEPSSCTYDLVKADGGYQVNSDGSGCNITYRKSSGEGAYSMEAQIVWDVTWNPTASPDGTPQNDDLPDGLSVSEQEVTVKEIQTVVR